MLLFPAAGIPINAIFLLVFIIILIYFCSIPLIYIKNLIKLILSFFGLCNKKNRPGFDEQGWPGQTHKIIGLCFLGLDID